MDKKFMFSSQAFVSVEKKKKKKQDWIEPEAAPKYFRSSRN